MSVPLYHGCVFLVFVRAVEINMLRLTSLSHTYRKYCFGMLMVQTLLQNGSHDPISHRSVHRAHASWLAHLISHTDRKRTLLACRYLRSPTPLQDGAKNCTGLYFKLLYWQTDHSVIIKDNQCWSSLSLIHWARLWGVLERASKPPSYECFRLGEALTGSWYWNTHLFQEYGQGEYRDRFQLSGVFEHEVWEWSRPIMFLLEISTKHSGSGFMRS